MAAAAEQEEAIAGEPPEPSDSPDASAENPAQGACEMQGSGSCEVAASRYQVTTGAGQVVSRGAGPATEGSEGGPHREEDRDEEEAVFNINPTGYH